MTWGYYWCPGCKEKKKVNSDLFQYDGDTEKKWCGKAKCKQAYEDNIRDTANSQAKKQAEAALSQIQDKMRRGEELDIDFENYAIPENQKQRCREYQKNWQDLQKLKKDRDKLEKEKQQPSGKKCDECGQISTSGKYYEVDGDDGSYCKSCARKIVDNYNNSRNTNDQDPPSKPSQPRTCDKCSSSFSKYYTIGGKGHYCNDCANELIKENNSPSKNNPAKQEANSSNYNQSPNAKKLAVDDKLWEQLKNQVKNGEKSADEVINKYDLPGQKEVELRDYETKRLNNSTGSGLNTPGKIGVSVLSVGGFIGLIFLVRKLHQKKQSKNKKIS